MFIFVKKFVKQTPTQWVLASLSLLCYKACMDIIPLELRKLGLKEKEVAVYLAGLKLGPSPLQSIAKEAQITRPTAYEVVRHLETKGLFSETTKGKKRYFLAQSPENILGIFRLQKREVEEKEREFIRIIAALEKKGEGIKVFRGKEGLEMLKERISFSLTPQLSMVYSDKKELAQGKAIAEKIKKRLGNVVLKELPGAIGGTLFLFDKAAFLSQPKNEGYLIEHPALVDVLKSLFNLLWSNRSES